jgi:hypothetical protein
MQYNEWVISALNKNLQYYKYLETIQGPFICIDILLKY